MAALVMSELKTSACMPTSFVTGESGCMFTNIGWLLVKNGCISYQKLKQ